MRLTALVPPPPIPTTFMTARYPELSINSQVPVEPSTSIPLLPGSGVDSAP
jgi:hypothetical protein